MRYIFHSVWTILFIVIFTACNQVDSPEDKKDIEAEAATVDVFEQSEYSTEGMRPSAIAELIDTDENVIGDVTFYDVDGKTAVELTAEGLSPGFHGFHIHDIGVCEADASDGPFTTAKGHYNPEGTEHPDHAGDLPVAFASEDGKAQLTVITDRFTSRELVEAGAGVIIHESDDNFANIPDRYQSDAQKKPGPDEETLKAGDAGSRAACGVVVAP
ncbi:superoxide dismutase family protein [Bacillaceae bacterium SIJ1]|uniref:superoxide dismutase family protein n=1 Tax=Litoribacterium kuwaitense TaxID=1398745 RepID=UPI0013EA8B57|nr:superoxide dismutase family protein [Litoribacterium kuwaitense]NGP45763.1 superoxide dismutase family protein [Litoribacterium kuwaitense]